MKGSLSAVRKKRRSSLLAGKYKQKHQFKGCTVPPIILWLVADAVFHRRKMYKNSLNKPPRIVVTLLDIGCPQRAGTINSSCFCMDPWLSIIH